LGENIHQELPQSCFKTDKEREKKFILEGRYQNNPAALDPGKTDRLSQSSGACLLYFTLYGTVEDKSPELHPSTEESCASKTWEQEQMGPITTAG